MTRYAAFLRGVNLGKRTVKSAELVTALEGLGLTNVKTLLASGNALFDARAGKEGRRTDVVHRDDAGVVVAGNERRHLALLAVDMSGRHCGAAVRFDGARTEDDGDDQKGHKRRKWRVSSSFRARGYVGQ